eukprot:11170924-Lingulodinium_polyedra.AAC.1
MAALLGRLLGLSIGVLGLSIGVLGPYEMVASSALRSESCFAATRLSSLPVGYQQTSCSAAHATTWENRSRHH